LLGLAAVSTLAAACGGTQHLPAIPDPTVTPAGPATWPESHPFPGNDPYLSGPGGPPPTTHWSFSTPNDRVLTDPTLVGDNLYFGTKSGLLYDLNPDTGKELWVAQTDHNWIMTDPVVADGLVIVGTGNHLFPSGPGTRGSGSNGLFAFDASTGHLVWSHSTSGENMPTPLVTDGRLFAVNGARQVLELQVTSGKVLGSIRIPSYVSMSSLKLASNGDLIFGGADPYSLYGISLKTGKIAYITRLPVNQGLDDCTPTVVGNEVLISGMQAEPASDHKLTRRDELFALNATTGKLEWQANLGANEVAVPGEQTGIATISNDVVYVGSPHGDKMQAFSAISGHLLWSSAVTSGIKAAPIVAKTLVISAAINGSIDVFAATNGALLSSTPFDASFRVDGATLDNDTLYLSNFNGQVEAVPLSELSPAISG
jgi:outer membrane protein assembly factor BamB